MLCTEILIWVWRLRIHFTPVHPPHPLICARLGIFQARRFDSVAPVKWIMGAKVGLLPMTKNALTSADQARPKAESARRLRSASK
jgi:hypothetical protein